MDIQIDNVNQTKVAEAIRLYRAMEPTKAGSQDRKTAKDALWVVLDTLNADEFKLYTVGR